MANAKAESLGKTGGNTLGLRFVSSMRKYWPYYLLFIPCLVMLIIFSYAPMYGVVLAFKDHRIKLGIMNSPWADPLFKHFQELFKDPYFFTVLRNTVFISLLRILAGFPIPILLALLFNELRGQQFKKSVQTILYLPHFISWVVLGGMFKTLLASDGLVNDMLSGFGVDPVPFLTSSGWFVGTLIVTEVWKSMGFASIIYLAAIAGVDGEQYEAATIDGAGRWKKMWHITLPGIAVAISINAIMALSGILGGGFDQIFNLYSPVVYDAADIIDTYVYRSGITGGNYELATALGLFKSAVGITLIFITNKITTKMGGEGLW